MCVLEVVVNRVIDSGVCPRVECVRLDLEWILPPATLCPCDFTSRSSNVVIHR